MNKSPTKRAIQNTSPQDEWLALGGENIWLSYAQMKTVLTPLMVERTEGSRIYLKDGRVLIDGVASWWTACHGYNHPNILQAMQEQLARMPHIMFDGLNHEPALRLAKRLAVLAPGDLNHVFFSDSGSIAVEVALKMAVQYWLNKDQPRTKFIHFRNGYHGDTMACMAVSDPDERKHAHFEQYLPKHFIADLPRDEKSTAVLDDLLHREGYQVAAIIIEPLVQGVCGMKFHDAETLRRISELCIKYKVLLIADEIFTGFGRTGTMFACEQANVVPDIMCLGKALTGGAITLAATLARDHVFAAFWADSPQKALMHGPTYMANPLACAATNASLDLFEREPRLEQVKAIEAALREGLEPCRELTNVVDVRVKGAIGVVELKEIKDANALKQAFIDQGVWLRPIGNVIHLTPAFTVEPTDLAKLTQAISETLK